jgi:hypothetical protein
MEKIPMNEKFYVRFKECCGHIYPCLADKDGKEIEISPDDPSGLVGQHDIWNELVNETHIFTSDNEYYEYDYYEITLKHKGKSNDGIHV